MGYDCGRDRVSNDVEGSTNNLWNKVSYHVPWIRKIAKKMGEELKDCNESQSSQGNLVVLDKIFRFSKMGLKELNTSKLHMILGYNGYQG